MRWWTGSCRRSVGVAIEPTFGVVATSSTFLCGSDQNRRSCPAVGAGCICWDLPAQVPPLEHVGAANAGAGCRPWSAARWGSTTVGDAIKLSRLAETTDGTTLEVLSLFVCWITMTSFWLVLFSCSWWIFSLPIGSMVVFSTGSVGSHNFFSASTVKVSWQSVCELLADEWTRSLMSSRKRPRGLNFSFTGLWNKGLCNKWCSVSTIAFNVLISVLEIKNGVFPGTMAIWRFKGPTGTTRAWWASKVFILPKRKVTWQVLRETCDRTLGSKAFNKLATNNCFGGTTVQDSFGLVRVVMCY